MMIKNLTAPDALDHYLLKGTKLAALDGLRGWAISFVVLYHSCVNGPTFGTFLAKFFTQYGWSGVDLFFVLSGFLITNILLQSKGHAHFFKLFYTRRILRIFPLYYAFLLFFFIYYGQLDGWPFHLFFLSNFYLIHFPETSGITPAVLTWSLALEEQFYLLWPLLIYFLDQKKMLAVCSLLLVIPLLVRTFIFNSDIPDYVSVFSTFARFDTIAYGAMIALLIRSNRDTLSHLSKAAKMILVSLPLIFLYFWAQRGHFLLLPEIRSNPLGLSFLALIYSSALVLSLQNSSTWINALLQNKFIMLAGKHSYCMYLIHNEVVYFWNDLLVRKAWFNGLIDGNSHGAMALFIALVYATTLALSIAIWHVFEKHFLNVKKYFSYS